MSWTFIITGRTSVLSIELTPSIKLDPNKDYVIGVIDLQTFNSVPNIEFGRNKFYIGEHVVIIPPGQYEIEDLDKYIKKSLRIKQDPNDSDFEYYIESSDDDDDGIVESKPPKPTQERVPYFSLLANSNTLKCIIESSMPVNFEPDDSIRDILGFDKVTLSAYEKHESNRPVNISKVSVMQVECNIATGSFKNGQPAHVLHEFYPHVPPGFKIIEVPTTIIYSEVNTRTINNVTVRIIDQNGEPIDFRGEEITLRLHLKAI